MLAAVLAWRLASTPGRHKLVRVVTPLDRLSQSMLCQVSRLTPGFQHKVAVYIAVSVTVSVKKRVHTRPAYAVVGASARQ